MTLDVLDRVAAVSGKNDKLQILKDNASNNELAELLDATFNYKRRFWVSKFDMPTPTSKTPLLNAHTLFVSLLKTLETRAVTGNDAKDCVEMFFTMCNSFQQQWYAKILRKDLKAGFSAKTAVKAGFDKIPLFDVMLAKDGKTCKKAEEIISKGVYVTPKYDGYRCLAIVDNGYVTLLSRNGTIYHNFVHIAESLAKSFPTGQYIFDGEIMSDDFQSMQQTAFSNKSRKSVGDVKYHVFGYVPFDEWTTKKFKMKTKERIEELSILSAKFDSSVKFVPHMLVSSLAMILQLEQQYLTQGFEGAMVLPDIPYFLGKKSNKLLKFKTMVSEDCEIMGFFEGKVGTENEGRLGGFVLKQENGLECKCGSGFSHEDREYIWNNQAEFLGEIVEVKYQEKTNHDIMRFPIFMRYRNDKT